MQYQRSRYTKQELVNSWKDVVRQIKKIPNVSEFEKYGLPDINYYNRAFKNYTNFKVEVGVKNVIPITYYKKNNPKRFFKPQEWIDFLNVIQNPDHKFWFEFLLHTGMRFDEASNVQVQDIDLVNKRVDVNKAKGGKFKQRTIVISSYLVGRIQYYIRFRKLSPTSTFNFPSLSFMSNKAIKLYCKRAGIADWKDFSCHNIRKTLEMYGCALNVNTMVLTSHLGHTIQIAEAFYVTTTLSNQQEKILIRSILNDLWI